MQETEEAPASEHCAPRFLRVLAIADGKNYQLKAKAGRETGLVVALKCDILMNYIGKTAD
jgi:hypothetical protein